MSGRMRHAEYMRKHRREKGRPKRFYIDVVDATSDIHKKFEMARNHIGHSVNNAEVLDKLIDVFLAQHQPEPEDITGTPNASAGYKAVKREEVDEQIFLTTLGSITTLVNAASNHATKHEKCEATTLHGQLQHMNGHCATANFTCISCQLALPNWVSSPYLPNQKCLVNYRMAHGYFASGLLPNQYRRFAEAAGIGILSDTYLKTNFKTGTQNYYTVNTEVAANSCRDALLMEVGETQVKTESTGEQYDGISIVTDARHGWRKNSRQTDVVCIGQESHRVISHEVVTSQDDPVVQRHERLGTERIYHNLTHHQDGPVFIHLHAHDRNMAVNKFIKDAHPEVINQNDVWHTTEALEKEIACVSKGPQYKHGVTWHNQLADKVASIRTHVNYIICGCNGNADAIRCGMDNIINHYKNDHKECPTMSRCRTDTRYLPSKVIITDVKAERLLSDALHKSTLYKFPQDYVMAKDAFYVESFNNVINMFHDKRIVFGKQEYCRRTQLAVLHWNENVDRPFTSMWIPHQQPGLRRYRCNGKKNYKKRTFHYSSTIWQKFMDLLFV